MAKSHSQRREDEVLLRMLKTPPQPRDEMKEKDKSDSKPPEASNRFAGFD
jgi:hypothetical protein